MELKQLEYFRAIAEEGSISEGARRLHMSQPPLSYQMKMLEQELEVTLFERGHKKIELTEAGRTLYERAGGILSLKESAAREVTAIGKRRTLHLGITPTSLPALLPFLSRFFQEHPEVHYEIYDGSTFELMRLLETRVIDLTMMRTPIQTQHFHYKVVRREPMILAAKSLPGFPDHETVFLSEAVRMPLIIYRRYHDLLLKELNDQNLSYDIFCECDDARTALSMARIGLGAAIFPESMEELCDGLQTRRLKEDNLVTEILLVWRKEKKLSMLQEHFVQAFDQ